MDTACKDSCKFLVLGYEYGKYICSMDICGFVGNKILLVIDKRNTQLVKNDVLYLLKKNDVLYLL